MKTYFVYECECCGKKFYEEDYPKSIHSKYCAMLDCIKHEEECQKLHDTDWHTWLANLMMDENDIYNKIH